MLKLSSYLIKYSLRVCFICKVAYNKTQHYNLKLGTRFREGIDFGFVYMDIMHVYPEDAGSYTLRATNALGQAVNSADLNVKSKEVIVKETMHAAAVEQIAHLEQSSQISQVSKFKRSQVESLKKRPFEINLFNRF